MIYVYVNNVNVYTENLSIENVVTSGPDTATFSIIDPDFVPSVGHDVYIYRDTTSDVLFRGLIIGVRKYVVAPNYSLPSSSPFAYNIIAQDYQQLLNQWLVNDTYKSKKCSEIISDIITNYTDPAFGFTTNNVSEGPTITDIRFSFVKVRDAITDLANLVYYEWYVDSNKDIHFFKKETVPAPFLIDEEAIKTKVFNFSISPDYSQVRNRVYVRGGYYLSDSYTESWVADGTSRIWSLGFKPVNVSSLTINGVSKTYAVDHLYPDDGTYQFFWNYQEKYLRCAEHPGTTSTPAEGDIIAITYQYEVPIIVRVDNTASQAAISEIRGGTGIIEHVIRDETITSRDIAQDVGLADVNQFGNAVIAGSFETYEHGIRAGQYVTIDVPGFEAFDGNYQIKRVSMKPSGLGNILYKVEFATTLYELKDLLNSLIKSNKRIKLRSDETVDVLKITEESLEINETTTTELNKHPVKYDEVIAIYDRCTYG